LHFYKKYNILVKTFELWKTLPPPPPIIACDSSLKLFCKRFERPAFSLLLVFFTLLMILMFSPSLYAQQEPILHTCDFEGPASSQSTPPIHNHIPPAMSGGCYNASDLCSSRIPFSDNWDQVDPVTVRLNFHFITNEDGDVNFGENDANCPSCIENGDFSAGFVAWYLVDLLNNNAQDMDDYIQYYEEGNTTRLDPPIPFLDRAGEEVPNLGDSKLRFELYEENGMGSVFIHNVADYNFRNLDLDEDCLTDQEVFSGGTFKSDFSVYGDKVIDVFIFDENLPQDYCRAIRGRTQENVAWVQLANMWEIWKSKNENNQDPEFFIYHYATTLAHEIGHVFSLGHTYDVGICCDADERHLENEDGGVYHVSNNIMGQNPAILTLSPCQLDKIFNNIVNQEHQFVDPIPDDDPAFADVSLSPPIRIDNPNGQVWSQDANIGKHVVVESGSKLTISENVQIRMAPGAHIWVDRGAMREIKNGAKITNLRSNCERWGGIWILGNKDRDHPDGPYEPFALDGEDPGRLVLNPDVLIENARWGVNTGQYFWLPNIGGDDPYWPSLVLWNPGGYIYADGATFKGCDQGIRFLPYDRENKSKLSNCEFLNGFFAPNPIKVGVAIDRNFGIDIEACKFQRITSHGILLKDASFNIHNDCEFKDIPGTAISALYTGMTPRFNYLYNISGNTFEDNLLDIRVESFPITRGERMKIKGNSFTAFWNSNNPDQNQTKNIEVFNSEVLIQNNDFDDTYHNISLNCRGEYETRIIDNDFNNFHTAIWYEELGNGKDFKHETQFACNSFKNNTSSGVLIDKSGINNQGDGDDYFDNEWDRDDNDVPIPGIYDIRVIASGLGDQNLVDPVFTYSVKENTPPLDPIRPLCNNTSGHPNCPFNQNYDLFEEAKESVCIDSDGNFNQIEVLTIDEIRDKLDSIDQYGDNAVLGYDYRDLEGRLYRLIKGAADSLLELNQFDAADSLLSLEEGVIYAQHRLGIRLYNRAYNEARTFLNTMPGENTEVADFKTVQHLHIDVLSDSIVALDSTELTTLESIAMERHIPSSHARALLSIIDGRTWDPVFPTIEEVDSVELHSTEKEESVEDKTMVFPNPSDGRFTIVPNSETYHPEKALNIQVYDVTGQRVFETQLVKSPSGNHELDLHPLAKGMYLLHIKQQGVQETVKLIKQ